MPCPSACTVAVCQLTSRGHTTFFGEVVLPNKLMDCSTYLSFLLLLRLFGHALFLCMYGQRVATLACRGSAVELVRWGGEAACV